MSLEKFVTKITRQKVRRLIYAFWYLPTYVTYAKILIYVRDHVQQFYDNCRSNPVTFLLFEILTYITFLFPLKLVLKIEYVSYHKNHTFFWKSGTQFCSAAISCKCTLLLKELCQIFFELELEHCVLTENSLFSLVL